MNERGYNKKLDFQKKIIERQSAQIENLKSQIDKLTLQCQEKDEIINSVASLKDELSRNVSEIKRYKEEYSNLINELRKMKKVMNQEVFKNRWWIIKRFIK